MENRLQDTIAIHRKKKKLTQEGLAMYLGVSASAVSKWESGTSYPDITLLAPLARALGITIDELLNFHSELSIQQASLIEENICAKFENEGFEGGREACYEVLKEYPQSARLRIRLAGLFQRYVILLDHATDEQVKELYLEAIEILKPAQEDNHTEMAMSARVLLVNYYIIVKDFEQAEETLQQLPKRQYIQEDFLPTLALMKEDIDQAQEANEVNFCWHFQSVLSSLMQLSGIASRRQQYAQAIQLLEIQESLIQATGWNHSNIGLLKASYLIKMNRVSEAMEALESVEFVMARNNNPNHPLHSMVEKRLKLQPYPMTILKQKLAEELLQDELYQPLYDEPDFQRLIKKWQNKE